MTSDFSVFVSLTCANAVDLGGSVVTFNLESCPDFPFLFTECNTSYGALRSCTWKPGTPSPHALHAVRHLDHCIQKETKESFYELHSVVLSLYTYNFCEVFFLSVSFSFGFHYYSPVCKSDWGHGLLPTRDWYWQDCHQQAGRLI